jgi:hypothetical protein
LQKRPPAPPSLHINDGPNHPPCPQQSLSELHASPYPDVFFGHDFASWHEEENGCASDMQRLPHVLYPGSPSLNIHGGGEDEREGDRYCVTSLNGCFFLHGNLNVQIDNPSTVQANTNNTKFIQNSFVNCSIFLYN